MSAAILSSVCSVFLLLIFVVVLDAAVWQKGASKVYASGTFTCQHHYHRRWCFRAVLMEIDSFSDDVEDQYGIKCTGQQTYEYELNGTLYGDGYNDNFFELQIHFYHNCSTHGSIRKQIHAFNDEPVTKKEIIRVRNYNAISNSSTLLVSDYLG